MNDAKKAYTEGLAVFNSQNEEVGSISEIQDNEEYYAVVGESIKDYGCDICCNRILEDDVNWSSGCDIGLCDNCYAKLNGKEADDLHNGKRVAEILEKYQTSDFMYNKNLQVNLERFVPYLTYDNHKIVDASGDLKTLNWSSIKTKLIQLSGRFCDSFASDIVIDINSIQKKMDKNELKDGDFFLFGFREMGVDHNSFIECKNVNELKSEYREIWKMDVAIDDGIKFELYRVKYNPYNNQNIEQENFMQKCLNCGYEFIVENTYTDELGLHANCPKCEASFDVNVEKNGTVTEKGSSIIVAVAYGTNDGNCDNAYFVQTCCNQEHSGLLVGQTCGCYSFGENFTEVEARRIAEFKAKELNVEIQRW